jgi:multicomponent Na+:H+ antiporter subunit G
MGALLNDIVVGLLLLFGACFVLTASIGLIRFPDLYTRMHAASKAGTLGSGLALLAIAFHSAELSIISRALAGIVFFLLTAPVSSHLLARAAYLTGTKPWEGTTLDEYAGQVDINEAEKNG